MHLLLFLVLFSGAYAQDFVPCVGGQGSHECTESSDIGHADEEGCDRNANPEMFYFRNGHCNKMRYLGCGGNRNRYCSLFECELLCGRNYNEEDEY